MASNRDDDILKINAFVDGELPPSERASVAARIASDRELARAHATFARLKAAVIETMADGPTAALAPQAPVRRYAGGLIAAAAVLVLAVVSVVYLSKERARGLPSAAALQDIVRVAFPVGPVLPDLGVAGLQLANVEIQRPGDRHVLVATYNGSRGCRLQLRVQLRDGMIASAEGTSRRAWVTGGLAYELLAFGMPESRFALVGAAAERQTRRGEPADADGRLRQAGIAAPPCLG